MRFKERPKEVEAHLFDGDTAALMDVVEWVKSQGYTWSDPFTPLATKGITMDPGTGFLGIMVNGVLTYAAKGDWLYCDVDGQVKVAKAGVFEATYEQVEVAPEPSMPTDPTPVDPAPTDPTTP